MPRQNRITAVATLSICILMASTDAAETPMPNEAEVGASLNKLFSYFGGVADYGVRPSATTIHSGSCLEIWADFQPDQFFDIAGFAVGTYGVSSPLLQVVPDADTFSVTLRSPPNGAMSFYVTVREDDNSDGRIDAGNDDDQWESSDVMMLPGDNVYNIAADTFVDANEGIGNGIRNFSTTTRMAYFITFETRPSYPGGVIEEPVTLLADHIGFYAGPQSIPPRSCPVDRDGNEIVDVFDLLSYLDVWFAASPEAELDGSPGIDVFDLLVYLDAWFIGC